LSNIDKQHYGKRTLSKEQLQEGKDRLRWFEKRDEDRQKTDKAKNDFETVIYALRDWINEDENVPFVGSSNVDDVLSLLRSAEDWLEDEGSDANYTEYTKKYRELNRKYESFKTRKDEHYKRDDAIYKLRTQLNLLKTKAEGLSTKKPWIKAEQV
jgi:molecular chaperone DnaK (HSP70)